jgi:four helix bundle protein
MKSTIECFEQLEAWQAARLLTRSVYRLTRAGRLCRDHGLTSQAQRASVSVMSNIAEGFGRHHLQEKLQFYNIARASVSEIRSLLYVIEDNYPEFQPDAQCIRDEAVRSGQIVSGLIRSTEARKR